MANRLEPLTRIDFYLTTNREALARERLACRITEKAFRLGHRVHLHLRDEAGLAVLDRLLWTFRDISFLPHGRTATDPDTRVVLCAEPVPESIPAEVLINLDAEVPGFFSRYTRVVEIVSGDATARRIGRMHFRYYRDRGYPLQHHEV